MTAEYDKPQWAYRVVGEEHFDSLAGATDAESAAEVAAEAYDQNDYALTRTGGPVEIELRNEVTGVVTRWSVRAEAVIRYYADEVEADAEAESAEL